MHFKSSFELRDVCGEKVLIGRGLENIDFGALINLNATAADIYTTFAGKDFTIDDVVEYITQEYDIDAEIARHDCEKLLGQLLQASVVE